MTVMNLSPEHPHMLEDTGVPGSASPAERPVDIESMLRLQRIRRVNLASLLEELGPAGLEPRIKKSKLLGLSREALQRAISGGGLTDDEAREAEWAMNRPRGWMDVDHHGEPD